MALNLPELTLVMIETQEHELARLAVEECLRQVTFGGVLIFTDKPKLFGDVPATFHRVSNWPLKKDWCWFSWFGVPRHLRTPYALCIQWDSWIWEVEKWRPEFLQYDYIGAPWWYQDGKNVGNGGFSIKSTRLMRFLATHQIDFPCDTEIDDDLLCRKYRTRLEQRGFTWAPESVAYDFAFECVKPDPDSRHFGFHAAFNFGYVLDHEQVLERVRIMCRSNYLKNSWMVKRLCDMNPWIISELGEGPWQILAPSHKN